MSRESVSRFLCDTIRLRRRKKEYLCRQHNTELRFAVFVVCACYSYWRVLFANYLGNSLGL